MSLYIETCIRCGCDAIATTCTTNGSFCPDHQPDPQYATEPLTYTDEQKAAFLQGRDDGQHRAVEVLCAALSGARWLSCAHLAKTLREECEEYNAPPSLTAAIEHELGISLEGQGPEREAELKKLGMLP